MNKKGIQLAANMVVILILGIVLLVGGLSVVYKVFQGGSEINNRLSNNQQQQLDLAMDDGALVAMARTQKSISRGKFDVFALGINNEIGETGYFKLFIDNGIVNEDGNSWGMVGDTLYIQGPYTINNNENKKLAIGIDVPKNAPSGVYILRATVCYNITTPGITCDNSDQYGDKKTIRVVVR